MAPIQRSTHTDDRKPARTSPAATIVSGPSPDVPLTLMVPNTVSTLAHGPNEPTTMASAATAPMRAQVLEPGSRRDRNRRGGRDGRRGDRRRRQRDRRGHRRRGQRGRRLGHDGDRAACVAGPASGDPRACRPRIAELRWSLDEHAFGARVLVGWTSGRPSSSTSSRRCGDRWRCRRRCPRVEIERVLDACGQLMAERVRIERILAELGPAWGGARRALNELHKVLRPAR